MNETNPTTAPSRWITPARVDRFEQITIVLLWALLAWRVLHSPNAFAPLVLVTETTVLAFVLIRRPTENISLKLSDWLLAITATCAPLLIVPTGAPVPQLAPLAVGLWGFGTLVQFSGKLFLRRSFGIAPANRGIKTDGMYRFVRHPIYAGYLFAHIGTLLLMPSLTNILIYAIGWCAQILRMIAEERLLSEDAAYRAFMQKTRWRLIPGVF